MRNPFQRRKNQPPLPFLMLAVCLVGTFAFCAYNDGALMPPWTARIRVDHPRLFFNRETWPQVKKRALGEERAWYASTRKRVDALSGKVEPDGVLPTRDMGLEAAWSAFVYRVTGRADYLALARKCLDASLRYYDACFAERKSVNWYATSRVHAILAWDWLYNDLGEEERAGLMRRLIRAVDRVINARPRIYRENISGYNTGFYGIHNCLWFLGCTAFGTGIEPAKVNEYLLWGYRENHKLLSHRREACGDDGGGASSTLGYVLGAYPWAEQNFFYTWLSATGENIAPAWPHSAWLANYVIWQWIPSKRGPLEFGYGDTPHITNYLPDSQLYTHMANICHLYGREKPFEAQLARYVGQKLPVKKYASAWFIYPFLFTGHLTGPSTFDPAVLPSGRHFDAMGQVIMRSGTGLEDTYCLFSCGGVLRQHRHYDALNFVIYHRGFLALDSGTRHDQFTNGQHLANYYAQTVAHNCVVIHQPGEPPAPYWGGKVTGNHGGQHKQLGSVVKAFETNPDYVYVAGDATACYRHGGRRLSDGTDLPEKCVEVTRQLVFLKPNFFVILDRVQATRADYRKDWLLHTAHEPDINGKTIRADHGEGRMFCRTVLPEEVKLTAVGGAGNAFRAAGRNWPVVSKNLTADQRALMGQWRVEVTPQEARKRDVFLHVIQVGDQSLGRMATVEKILDEKRAGVRIKAGDATWQVVFNTDGVLGGHVKRTGAGRRIDAPLAGRVQRQVGILAKPYERVTLEEARRAIPKRVLPPFWVGDVAGLTERFKKVKKGKVRIIARSPGGRPVHLLAYGEPERQASDANFNSALGARNPAAYLDKQARKKPVILLIGPVHGHEVEALTGLVNLVEIMETGRDLRGKAQPVLQDLGRRCRLLIIPDGNPDGIARFAPRSLIGMTLRDLRFWGQGTWADDTLCGWPESKALHPMAGPQAGFVGCYFNDIGVNPMHDEFLAPISTEAPAILKVARAEGPDLAVSLHSHANVPALLRPAYVTLEVQEDIRSLAEKYYQLMAQRGLPHARPFEVKPDGGQRPAPFNLTSAVYHISGARTFTFECPHGMSGERACKVTCEQILDVQLTLYEAMMRYELDRKKL